MNKDDQIEAHIQKNEKAINELLIKIEVLNKDVEALLTELNVSPAQLTAYIENEKNFTTDNWNTLQDQQKQLNEKLLRDLLNIRNPKKAKESFKQMHVQPHWLYVR